MTLRPFSFRPRVSPLPPNLSLDRLLGALGEWRGVAVLDGEHRDTRRTSVVAFHPLAVPPEEEPRSVTDLRAFALRLHRTGGDAVPGPFHGGFLGALSYDLGVEGEAQHMPRDPWCSRPIAGGLYTDFIVVEHDAGSAWLVLGDGPGDGRAPLAERRDAVLAALADPRDAEGVTPLGPLVRDVEASEHRARIERLRGWIGAGELYQANLAHRLTRRVACRPVDLFRSLRNQNPAPHAAYLAWGDAERPDGALVSVSPELLLETDGLTARTRPIKGTAARGHDDRADARERRALLASAKDRAELAMIVDLERNDLGRVARTGTVRVGEFPALKTYRTLHHLVADVECELRSDCDAVDALRSVFPGGSITGAPKLRAMEAIAALEGEGRGFFTGSLGFLDTRGHARLSILIRTVVWRPDVVSAGSRDGCGEVSFHVGGGITWGSEPFAEELKTRVKGAALAAAVAGDWSPAGALGIRVPGPAAPPGGAPQVALGASHGR